MTNPAPSPKRQPVPFGKYLLLDRINIGGMAEVWRGKSFGAGGFERLVAIKRILPNIAEDEEFISMFIDEAKISVQLTHANIAQIHELGNLAGSYFIAMEYIPGKDVKAIFDKCRKKGEPAPVPLTCYVVAKMCEGLDYAHRKKDGMSRELGIVHRDISPQNVLISYEGEVKVIDFGIAKAAGKATKTQAGILKGKFGYMSPEQIRGLPLDRRSDVFAIGVCLYEMLTGERLFVGDSDFSVLEKVRKAEVLPPSTYNKRIPEALEKIVLKALAKEVEDRYQYANEVADDLQRFLITSESIFSRKDLMQYMKSTFAEEVEREKVRIQEYQDIKMPEGMIAAMEMGYGANAKGKSQVGLPPVQAAPANTPRLSQTGIPAVAPAAKASATNLPAVPSGGTPKPAAVPRTSPSLTNLPKLTAVAPVSTGDDEGGGATMMVDSKAFGDGDNVDGDGPHFVTPDVDPQADQSTVFGMDAPTFPPQGAPTQPPGHGNDATVMGMDAPTLPPQNTGKRPPSNKVNAPVIEQRKPGNPPSIATKPVPAPRPPPPAARPPDASPPGPVSDGGLFANKNVKIFGGIGLAAVAVIIGLGVSVLKGPSTGHLVLQIPSDAVGKVQVNIDNANVPWPLDDSGKHYPIFILREIKAGSHLVIVSGQGFEPWSGAANVTAGNELTQVKVDLKKLMQKTQLVVVLTPDTAELKINGEVVKREGEVNGAWVGEALTNTVTTIEARAKGFQKFTQKATAKPGEPLTVKATLQSIQFALNVSSEPEGATIFVAGKEVGVTPASIKVAGGVGELILKKNCFDAAKLPLQLPNEPGDAQAVKGSLKKQPGCK